MKRRAWAAVTALLAISPAVAQPSRAQAPAPAPADVARPASLREVVQLSEGHPVVGAVVTVSTSDTVVAGGGYTRVTNERGVFSVDSLAPGWYVVRIRHDSARAFAESVSVAGAVDRSVVLLPISRGEFTWPQLAWTLLCLTLYLFSLLMARWHNIALPVHEMLDRQLMALSTRLETEVGDPPVPDGVRKLQARVADLRKDVCEANGRWRRLPEFLFWSRGRENALWVAIHEIERQLAAFLSPAEHVETSLRWADAELRLINKPPAICVADMIRGTLQATPPADAAAANAQARMRASLLGRGISLIYAERDTSFSTLMEWHNKASWLIVAALLVITFMVGAAGHSVLFLAGAAGGFLSRLMRTLKREDVPLDYGASWTTLFLSPLLGALAGWFGVALIALASDPQLNLLGSAFRQVRWDDPYLVSTLAIAFLLGFSERFFDAVVGAVDDHAISGEAARRAATGAGTAIPVSPDNRDSAGGTGRATGPATERATERATGGQPAPTARGAPVIAKVERKRRSNGDPQDALLVTGTAFDVDGATATVNERPHKVTVHSTESALIPLEPEDLDVLEAGGDFHLVIANGDGAASAPFDVV